MMIDTYESYLDYLRELAELSSTAALLNWDKEVNMPSKGFETRSRQLGQLQGMIHKKFTDEKFGDGLLRLIEKDNLTPNQKINVKRTLEDYEKANKLDQEFVIRSTKVISEAFHYWSKGRKHNRFHIFLPSLLKVVQIKKEEADKLGFEEHPYDALLDHYEPGMKVSTLDPLFDSIKRDLSPVVEKIRQASQVDSTFLLDRFPKEKQWDFSMLVLKDLGYDFEAGRQDYSPHPFTISMGPGDVRITTRVNERDFSTLLWSTIHEAGHALYEQNLNPNLWGSPLGSAASLSIHESQSRLYENHIGRSKVFWRHYYPILKETFNEALGAIPGKDFYKGINQVTPGFIRTEADELHYHFHILIRYELEKSILTGELDVLEIKEYWNEAYKKYLGVNPADDNDGILQDIHWAHGSLGYFPTYTLGSFYAAQFFASACASIPDLENKVMMADFGELLGWLREMIYRRGRKYYSEDLCKKVTGEKLNTRFFIDYTKKKYGDIYGINDWN